MPGYILKHTFFLRRKKGLLEFAIAPAEIHFRRTKSSGNRLNCLIESALISEAYTVVPGSSGDIMLNSLA
jgi:hypothetical protein